MATDTSILKDHYISPLSMNYQNTSSAYTATIRRGRVPSLWRDLRRVHIQVDRHVKGASASPASGAALEAEWP
jgi:hypothetical protein